MTDVDMLMLLKGLVLSQGRGVFGAAALVSV
jgi:hypothetical protein